MAEQKEVKFLQSLTMAINDKDGEIKHVQLVIVQEIESGDLRAYFDVVDPSKVKLQENELPTSCDA